MHGSTAVVERATVTPSRARALSSAGVTVALSLLLTVLGVAGIELRGGGDTVAALAGSGLRLVVGTLWFMLPVWAVAIVVLQLRGRRMPVGRMFAAQMAVSVACALLATGTWFVVALVEGGWALLLVAISALTTTVFLAAASVSIALVQFWWFRPRPQ